MALILLQVFFTVVCVRIAHTGRLSAAHCGALVHQAGGMTGIGHYHGLELWVSHGAAQIR
jgi:hypothetical protein